MQPEACRHSLEGKNKVTPLTLELAPDTGAAKGPTVGTKPVENFFWQSYDTLFTCVYLGHLRALYWTCLASRVTVSKKRCISWFKMATANQCRKQGARSAFTWRDGEEGISSEMGRSTAWSIFCHPAKFRLLDHHRLSRLMLKSKWCDNLIQFDQFDKIWHFAFALKRAGVPR